MNSKAEEHDASCKCEYTENLELLRQIDFFSGFPIEKLKIMAYLCTRESFAAEEQLFAQSEDDGQAFFIISGQVELTHERNGAPEVVERFGPGAFLGGLSLLGRMRRLFALKATEKTVCLVMSRDKFVRSIEQFPELVPKLLNAVAERIRSWEKRHLFDMIEKNEPLAGRAGVSIL
ncbi:MAG: Crp/Fnr family transcriptional regulator [Desulfobacterales bacterium]